MPFSFSCPHCGSETEVEDQYAGQSGPCYMCGRLVTVPHRESHAAASPGLPSSPAGGVATAARPKSVKAPIVSLMLALAGGVAAACVVIAVLVTILLPAFKSATAAARERKCQSNLEQIVAAMRQYALEHGTYPPAYLADANGKPMHSWRVLLLPYLGHESLYEQYNFDQPWDSVENMALVGFMPDVYACPADPDALAQDETNYMVIVGKNTAFPGDGAIASTQLTDDPATTILVVESPAKGVSWLEPKDLDVGTFNFNVNMGDREEIGSNHFGGAHIGMADGTAQWLDEVTPSETVESLTTISGGEQVPYNVFDHLYPY